MGLFGLDIPEEYGGPGVAIVTRTLMAIEMAQHRAGLYAPCYGGIRRGRPRPSSTRRPRTRRSATSIPPCGARSGRSSVLPSPREAADPARAIQTRAVRDGGDWVINGSKIFISGADRADYGIVFARTDPAKGRAGVTCFIVETDWPGFYVRRVVHTLRSANYATELQFEDLRVPAGNVLGEVGGGFAIANDRLSRQRIPYAAACIGVAIAAQEMTIEYARLRETFGAPLATRQSVQNMIIDSQVDIESARWLTLAAAERAHLGEPFRKEAAMAKLVASEAGGRVVDRAIQVHGGYGVTKDLPLERWYREMRIRRIGEGPSEVQRLIIARDLIGGAFH